MGFVRSVLYSWGKRFSTFSPPFHLRWWKWLRLSILLTVDLSILVVCYWAAFLLRFDWAWPDPYHTVFLRSLPFILLVQVPVFFRGGLYRQLWRFANYHTALTVAKCTSLAELGSILVFYFMKSSTLPPPPRSIFIIHWVLCTMLIAASRFSWRAWTSFVASLGEKPGERCLIYGAGSGGDLLARHIASNPKFPYTVVGFIDDDPNKRGRVIHGVRILGTAQELAELRTTYQVGTVIIALPSAPGKVIRDTVARCHAASIRPLIMPDIASSLGEEVFQPRAIDTKDLLKRAPKSIDREKVRQCFAGRTVLVTGAGGSIGSEICRQVVTYHPERLILLDSSEFNLYQIETELEDRGTDVEIHAVLGSTANWRVVQRLFDMFRPALVLHAAANKHVPLLEKNPIEGVLNNVYGTQVLARAAVQYEVERFLLISSDKAVRPTSVMGATKRSCELIMQLMQQDHGAASAFCSVRFGNVLGSSGSVIPRFLQQIQAGGPVTVTHPEVTRFFMLTSEAVGLVLQSIAMARGGEIFVLNMGEPVKILEMARQLIRLSGKEPGKDIEIAITGLRPGEKLYEELILDGAEKHSLHDDVFVAKPYPLSSAETTRKELDLLVENAMSGNEHEALKRLKRLAQEPLHPASDNLASRPPPQRTGHSDGYPLH